MWHARRPSVMALHDLSKLIQATHTDDHNPGHSRETANIANRTSTAFKKFCKQILQATQLSESVILLSLKYIAMLLQNNPSIQGADGSEYRLFTVALMLGNKFLDDNTFTNKTWSEVSGMKVTDLNIMELEFLDVLRFKLSVQKEEYERWRTALFGFRSQLMGVPVEIQRQKLMETMALSVGNTQQQWSQQYKHHQVQQQHQAQQHHHQQQQQQHAAAVAAVTHNFFLFSKAQQQYPVQPTFNGPLTRVPLRIPAQPVYHNIRTTPSAPPNVLTPINVYDSRSNVVVPSTTTCSTQSQLYSTGPTSTIATRTANIRRPSET
ncbi:hypothetical protein G6F42_024447 [Rhizopus arrhizus]|nr:hypothetical protein G6F42_024447 [Rhizopus arrhizus]